MLLLNEKVDVNYRKLIHGDSVFHDALRWVQKGEYRFHVSGGAGIEYDLVYKENNRFLSDTDEVAASLPGAVLPPYFTYDETDADKLSLEVLDGYEEVLFEELNEYTVVIAGILLRETGKKIVFSDERISWFLPASERIRVVKEETSGETASESAGPGETTSSDTFVCCKERAVLGGVLTGRDGRMSAESLFHNIFIWQWMTDLPLSQIKYAAVTVLKTEGIGAVVDHFMRMKDLFAKRGIRAYLQTGCTRYDDHMLQQLFRFDEIPEDVDETNTINLPNFVPLRLSELFYKSKSNITLDVLNPMLLDQIDEYYDAVFGGQKVLGVLIRGTDYINLKLDGIRRQATADEMIPVIDQWIEEDGYERIFLATEDADILEKMYAYYGKKMTAVSQIRHRVSDFKKGQYLSELEKEKDEDQYEANVIDTTINYYYALVILSKCASFMVSGHVNGWDVVRDLNGGKFLRTLRFGDQM